MTESKISLSPPIAETAFEVAFWFLDAALDSKEYLQPQKLHRLMFLAQAYYAVAYAGRQLMPGQFVADEMGPIEPNIYAAFSAGRPTVDVIGRFEEPVEVFLDSIWRRFGHYSPERLNEICRDTKGYLQAREKGARGIISLAAMREDFGTSVTKPSVQKVMRSRVMRDQTGKPVAVNAWLPGALPEAKPDVSPPPMEEQPQRPKKITKAVWPTLAESQKPRRS
ncbi:Panacea domain-containing protein [Magnetospira sp. QH-2]|uniref:Panacea domain-containing protein n=1 Tax=Magnetospira sp. (strain QH-2) TaxID=1288970 RepID=UPI0003E80F57|nr:type II toxin-antitoxin system antitoxin SocA domain-containing protein [Magnetospira sp. QH-2]CCQ73541.1 Conserved protein of unknown function [Magnetospira sp. QH-2]